MYIRINPIALNIHIFERQEIKYVYLQNLLHLLTFKHFHCCFLSSGPKLLSDVIFFQLNYVSVFCLCCTPMQVNILLFVAPLC